MLRFSLSVLVGALLCLPMTEAIAIDLTTYGHSTEQARVARYTVEMGMAYGDTVGEYGDNPFYHGAYDYASYRGAYSAGWGEMNDGNLGSFLHTWIGTDAEDYFGYRFKRPAAVTELNWSNFIFDNGGTFVSTPRVEVLTGGPLEAGGTWQTIAVAWNVPYDTTYIPSWGTRQYVITPVAPTGDVYGVRIIGDPSGTSPDDPTGHVGCGELEVSGNSTITDRVDLSVNLALGQTPLWTHGATQYGRPGILTDGDYTYANHDTTYNETLTAAKDFVGVMFDTPQSNVAAVGATMIFFDVNYNPGGMSSYTGGWIASGDLTVEYTTDDGATWTPVTGLDLGRLPAMEGELESLVWSYIHSELLMFDTIAEPIDGIRLAGPAVVRNSGDPDGFVGSLEFEAFRAVPEPSSLVLLICLAALLSAWRRKR
jgi:hypothetical protein